MKSILYYRRGNRIKSEDSWRPIYHVGPFWAFWLINVLSFISNFGLDARLRIEDRFTKLDVKSKK